MRTPEHIRFSLLWASESGLTLGQILLSLGAAALILVVAYYGGSYWGEDMGKILSPAFDWR